GDDHDDRVWEKERKHDDCAQPDEPHPRRHRGHRPAAVQRDHRQQVEEVQEEAGEGQRGPHVAAGQPRDRQARRRADRPEDPASPTRASAAALPPSDLAQTTAPMNGMNTGALAFTPSRRSAMTWPISWTKSRITNPMAKRQPQISE